MRFEKDTIGRLGLEDDALYGIHSLRARMNFPDQTSFHKEWYQAMGTVKKACYQAALGFLKASLTKYGRLALPDLNIGEPQLETLAEAATEVEEGNHFSHFIVPAVQGGAGTSINMNVNEILANVALLKTGRKQGQYEYFDPVEHANLFQSTNDVVPTALKIAAMRLLLTLEGSINGLRQKVEEKEKESRHMLRIGYTQMQEAVPTSYGRLFSTYNDALSRDWWRVSKCAERIRQVNIGGSAIGTAITVPRYFIHEVTAILQRNTGLPITRAENLQDNTANLDSLVEVHSTMKAHAVNLEKMVSDIRLLSSDLVKNRELTIPRMQAGSSIMPGKINPVIPEFVISVSHKVYSNDMLISNLCGQGCLDLNAYLPLIGHALLDSLKLLTAANDTLKNNLMVGLIINSSLSLENLLRSPSVTTALLPYIGFNKATALALEMKGKGIGIFEANANLGLMEPERIHQILEPSGLLKEGFVLKDILGDHE